MKLEKNNIIDLSCKNCSYPLEAYQPDAIYSIPLIEICFECRWATSRAITRNHECQHCDTINTIFWHSIKEHTREEKKIALYNEKNWLKRIGAWDEKDRIL